MTNEDYSALEETFTQAVTAHTHGDEDRALTLFKKVLSIDPRLPEARLEVAMILLRRGRLDEAEAQAREALEQVEKGWRSLDAFTDEQLLAHASNLVAEILKARIGDDNAALRPDAMRALWEEAGRLVARAAELDPDNPDVMRNYYGFKRSGARGGPSR